MSKTVTPQGELAQRIVSKLVALKLIPKSHEEQALHSIETGKASAEDWSMWVDMAADKDEAHG